MKKNIWDRHPDQQPIDPWNESTYQTGSTIPPKSHNGILAALLVVVIVLCGTVTVLGLTSVKLFRATEEQNSQELPFSFSTSPRSSSLLDLDRTDSGAMFVSESLPVLTYPLGLQGKPVPKLYQLYYRLPQGLYVDSVEQVSSAASMGIHAGDIVTALGDTPIAGPADLAHALKNYFPGQQVVLTIYRNSRQFYIPVLVEPIGE